MFHFLSGDVHENVYVNEGPAPRERERKRVQLHLNLVGKDVDLLLCPRSAEDETRPSWLHQSIILIVWVWLVWKLPLPSSYFGCFLDFGFHSFLSGTWGPWLAATGAIRWHMSRSPATTCRRFDAAGLSDPWFEGNEVVWMVLNESTWRWWEKFSLWIFLEFELGMPLAAVQVAYINEPNQPEGDQLPEVWLGSRFCGHWVCRCLFYFTVQWFLYYQDDLPISSLSNVYDKCCQFFHDLLAGIPRRTKLPVEALLVTLVCAKCIPAIDVSISRCGWVEWLSIFVYWRWCINGHKFNTYIYIYIYNH